MRIRVFAALLAIAAVAFSSCKKEEPLGDPNLQISKTTIEFPKEGGTQTIVLKSTLDWGLKDYTDDLKSWLVIDPASGSASNAETTVTIKASANTGINRSASVTFFGNVLQNQTLTITQPGEMGETESVTVAEFLKRKDTQTVLSVSGKVGFIVNSSSLQSFYVKDDTGELCCPFPENWSEYASSLSTGGIVTIKGKYEYYSEKSQDQLADGVITSYVQPTGTTIEQITVADFLGRKDGYSVYRLEGTVASSVNTQYCSFDLKDATGTVKVYTVNNASEWGSKVKQNGTVTLRGAYTLYTKGETSTPEVVDAWIEKFTEAEPVPTDDIFTIDFLSGKGSFTIDNKVLPEGLTSVWTESSSYGMVASGYISQTQANAASEGWLVSPVIDLASQAEAYLSFEYAVNKFASLDAAKAQTSVYVKAEGGEWAKLDGMSYPAAQSWSFIPSGSMDLKAYLGKKIQFAFVYTSTVESSGSWEIKNAKVSKKKSSGPDLPEGSVIWEIGSAKQTWAADTDTELGTGFAATVDGIKVGYYKDKSTTAPITASADHFRVYKSSALKITSDKTLKKIVLYCTESKYCVALTMTDGSTVAADAGSNTLTWTGSTKEFVAKANSAQVRIKKIAFVVE